MAAASCQDLHRRVLLASATSAADAGPVRILKISVSLPTEGG
jgi:hypothetical protein